MPQWNFKNLIVIAALFSVGFGIEARAEDRVGEAIARAGSVDTQTTDELKLANEAFYDAFSNRDIWTMGQLWVKEDYSSSIFPAGSKPAFGWDNVRRSWQQTFDHNRDIKIESLAGLIQPQGEDDGDIAIVLDSTQFKSFQTQTGQPVMMPNVLTTKIFERRDGNWLLVHYHAHQPGLKPPTAGDEEVGTRPLVTADAPDVKAADNRFYEALRSRDVDAMEKVWSPVESVTAIQPEASTPFIGRGNVMNSWIRLFEYNKNIEIPRVSQSTVHVLGDRAWLVGSFEAGLTRQTGEFIHLADVLTTKIYEKRDDGTWYLIHYHGHIGPLAHTHDPQAGLPGLESGVASLPPPSRTIEIEASEMTFGVENIQAKPGEVLRFVITNKGHLRHEFALGSPEEHEQMRVMMRMMPNMVHNTDTTVTVEPGETKVLTWRVPENAEVEFSCNIPGHSEGGMKGTVEITE